MGIRKVEKGPTSARAARNVRALREARGLSLAGLSQRLAEVGRPMIPNGLSKLENGERRLDVDDLMALSVALGVNPSRLLLPVDGSPDAQVEITETVSCPAWRAWEWADGFAPFDDDLEDLQGDRFEDFQMHARPASLRRLEMHPAARAAKHLRDSVLLMIRQDARTGKMLPGMRIRVQRNWQRLQSELEHLDDEARN